MAARSRALADDQQGFTLVELVIAMAIGMVVLAAVFSLMDSGARSAQRTSDRAELTQRSRVVTNVLQRKLRSQQCLDENTPPIALATDSQIWFYTDTDSSPYFVPEINVISYDATYKGGRGAIWDYVIPADQGPGQGPPWTYNGGAKPNLLTQDVTLIPGKPFITYYAWNAPTTPMTTPLSSVITGDSIPQNSQARVVHLQLNFRLRPDANAANSSGPVGNQNDTSRDGDVTTDVYVPNTDYSDGDAANRVWGPRCG